MKAKRWISLWIAVVSIFIFSISSINYYIDSLALFPNSYLDSASQKMVNGEIIAGLKNFDDRKFRKAMIQNTTYPVEWVAIGSSRTMQLRQRHILDGNISFQNYSVAGASIEDYIGILAVYKKQHNALPKNIILGIDPWVFNRNNNQTRYKVLAKDINELLSEMNSTELVNTVADNNLKKLCSINYVKENIKFLKARKGINYYYIADSIEVDDYLREPDGSLHYPFYRRHPDFEKVKELAKNYTKGKVYSLENFSELANRELFNLFIDYLKENNVNIIFYLPPYNPITYDILKNNPKYAKIDEVENYLTSISKKKGITLIGSYNPHLYNLQSTDFFDGMHSLEKVYIDIFKSLKTTNSLL